MSRRVQTWAAVTVTTLAAGMILSACGGSDPEITTGDSGAKSGEPVKKDISIILSHAGNAYAQEEYKGKDDPYVKEMSRLSGYNLNVEILNHGDAYAQQLTVRFASGELADLVRTDSINSTIHPGALEQGAFTDLGPLIDKYGPNLKKSIPKEAWESSKVSKDGKIFGIPAMTAMTNSRVVMIRQDWLDKLNMKTPVTVDDYLAFFEAVKNNDMDGNGKKDEYGFYVRENLQFSDLFFNAVGVNPDLWQMKNGQMTPGIIMPEIKEAIKFWKMLYDKGYVNPDMFTKKATDWSADIKKGKGGLWAHEVPNYTTGYLAAQFPTQPGAKVSMIAPPKGPKGSGLVGKNDGIYFVWVIPSKTKNPEEVIKFLNWAWSDEVENFLSFGVKGSNYTEENGQVKYDSELPINKNKNAFSFHRLILNPRGDGRMLTKIVDAGPEPDKVKAAMKLAESTAVDHASLNMPILEAFKTRPEINIMPGPLAGGTLFLDMFAKVVTGKEELDPAFDKFVAEWKKRGGDEAMKEATAWYNKTNKK
ncbi:extracellular solute-binding protein [Paenibacillus koleovorans]|uniref:extracellular solute-binding protein n=1 Tax=Paenibacillus koleovorans TaxID=121608 RepID=UPI000FDABD6B|nr:extracellular solute-binding protein [Paenibacillus koleovorans]